VAAAIYVMGHKNPDTDAICSAVGYAALLQVQGHPDAVATRQGPLRRETAYILDRFQLPVPLLVTDVRPRVRDIMTAPPSRCIETLRCMRWGRSCSSTAWGPCPSSTTRGVCAA